MTILREAFTRAPILTLITLPFYPIELLTQTLEKKTEEAFYDRLQDTGDYTTEEAKILTHVYMHQGETYAEIANAALLQDEQAVPAFIRLLQRRSLEVTIRTPDSFEQQKVRSQGDLQLCPSHRINYHLGPAVFRLSQSMRPEYEVLVTRLNGYLQGHWD